MVEAPNRAYLNHERALLRAAGEASMVGMLLGVWVTNAVAAEPPSITPASTPSGSWRTEFVVPVPIASVRAALADPIAAARFSPDISAISYVAQGACPTLSVQTAGVIPIAYAYRRCATPNGWHETLVDSASLEAYEVTWTLAPEGDGTKVSYEVHIDPSFPAPDFMFARAMRTSITTLLGRLYRAVTG